MTFPVDIVDRPETRLGCVRHVGPFPEIGAAFQRVGALVSAAGIWPQTMGMVGVYHDNPQEVAAENLRSDAGVILSGDAPLPDGLTEVTLPAGRHAVLHLTGPYERLPEAWHWLYSEWMPQTGATVGGVPFEIYLNDPGSVAPDEVRTDICVPLQG